MIVAGVILPCCFLANRDREAVYEMMIRHIHDVPAEFVSCPSLNLMLGCIVVMVYLHPYVVTFDSVAC